MLSNMWIAAEQVAILYVMVALGYIADKTGLFTRPTALLCTNLLFYIVTPAKIIQSFFTMSYDRAAVRGLFIAIGCGLLMHTVSAGMSTFLFRKSSPDRAAVFQFSCAYGNCGYMSLPLVDAILGSQGVFYCSAVVLTFQVFAFSHGIYLMTRGDSETQRVNVPRGGTSKKRIEWRRLFLNPGMISVAIGLPLFLWQVKLPNLLGSPINAMAALNTPLAMLIFGTYLAHTRLLSTFKEWRIYCVALVKLIILPLVMLGLYYLLGISGVMLTALLIPASAPPANNTVVFAAKYEKDPGLASQVVGLVSLMSIFTMPVMIGLAGLL